MAPTITDDDMIQSEAVSIVEQRTAANQPVRWPAGKTQENAEALADYPQDIVQEATTKWSALPPEEKAKQKVDRQEMIKSFSREIAKLSGGGNFSSMFSFYDILCVGIAGLAAFKFGSGLASED